MDTTGIAFAMYAGITGLVVIVIGFLEYTWSREDTKVRIAVLKSLREEPSMQYYNLEHLSNEEKLQLVEDTMAVAFFKELKSSFEGSTARVVCKDADLESALQTLKTTRWALYRFLCDDFLSFPMDEQVYELYVKWEDPSVPRHFYLAIRFYSVDAVHLIAKYKLEKY